LEPSHPLYKKKLLGVMNFSKREIVIENRKVGFNCPCFVIAEVGVNHNGDIDTALAMVDAIAETGADCAKFQTYTTKNVIRDPNEIYEYVSGDNIVKETQRSMLQRLELKHEDFSRLFARARERGVVPLSTPSDELAVDLLDNLGAGAFKIGSDDITHTPFLEYVGSKGKPVIISTGMADAEDIERAINTLICAGTEQICILHCVSLYPTPDDQINLKQISTLIARFPFVIGFSDHSDGIISGLGAVALGASVVEKHFTLNKNMEGPDHSFSADPLELGNLVSAIRRLEMSLGDPSIVVYETEQKMRRIARRSIVAGRDLSVGHIISADDLAYLRPGTGLMPYEKDNVLGHKTRVAIAANEIILLDQLR